MNLKVFKCKGCYYFRKGKCLCYIRPEGPRGDKDCPSCRCVVISYILAKKKHTQKIFYHLRLANKGKSSCGCQLKCKLRNDGLACHRIGPKGKRAFIFHKKCASGYKKCRQMKKLEKNLLKFTQLVEEHGQLEIPNKCVPFLGTKQRNYSEFSDSCQISCLEKRDTVATKTKLKLSWSRKKMETLDFFANVSSSSDSEKTDLDKESQSSSRPETISSQNTSDEETEATEANSESENSFHLFADITEETELATSDIVETTADCDRSIQSHSSNQDPAFPERPTSVSSPTHNNDKAEKKQNIFEHMSGLLEYYGQHMENLQSTEQVRHITFYNT